MTGSVALANALKQGACRNLEVLELTGNGIGNGGCAVICDALGGCPKLEELFFANNSIQTLPDDLQNLHTIKLLDVSNNGLQELPESLGQLPRVTTLNIQGNKIKRMLSPFHDLILRLQEFQFELKHFKDPSQRVMKKGLPVIQEHLRQEKTKAGKK